MHDAPEIVEGQFHSKKSDIWALGVLLYEMCAEQNPFYDSKNKVIDERIVKGIYDVKPLQAYSLEVGNLVSTLLKCNADERPEISEILKVSIISAQIESCPRENIIEGQNNISEADSLQKLRENNLRYSYANARYRFSKCFLDDEAKTTFLKAGQQEETN